MCFLDALASLEPTQVLKLVSDSFSKVTMLPGGPHGSDAPDDPDGSDVPDDPPGPVAWDE